MARARGVRARLHPLLQRRVCSGAGPSRRIQTRYVAGPGRSAVGLAAAQAKRRRIDYPQSVRPASRQRRLPKDGKPPEIVRPRTRRGRASSRESRHSAEDIVQRGSPLLIMDSRFASSFSRLAYSARLSPLARPGRPTRANICARLRSASRFAEDTGLPVRLSLDGGDTCLPLRLSLDAEEVFFRPMRKNFDMAPRPRSGERSGYQQHLRYEIL